MRQKLCVDFIRYNIKWQLIPLYKHLIHFGWIAISIIIQYL